MSQVGSLRARDQNIDLQIQNMQKNKQQKEEKKGGFFSNFCCGNKKGLKKKKISQEKENIPPLPKNQQYRNRQGNQNIVEMANNNNKNSYNSSISNHRGNQQQQQNMQNNQRRQNRNNTNQYDDDYDEDNDNENDNEEDQDQEDSDEIYEQHLQLEQQYNQAVQMQNEQQQEQESYVFEQGDDPNVIVFYAGKGKRMSLKTKYSIDEVKVQDFRSDDNTSTKNSCTYNCPICFRYFDKILQSTCCENYTCHYCLRDLYLKAKQTSDSGLRCCYCQKDHPFYVDVNKKCEKKIYSDSPQCFQKQTPNPICQQSSIKKSKQKISNLKQCIKNTQMKEIQGFQQRLEAHNISDKQTASDNSKKVSKLINLSESEDEKYETGYVNNENENGKTIANNNQDIKQQIQAFNANSNEIPQQQQNSKNKKQYKKNKSIEIEYQVQQITIHNNRQINNQNNNNSNNYNIRSFNESLVQPNDIPTGLSASRNYLSKFASVNGSNLQNDEQLPVQQQI